MMDPKMKERWVKALRSGRYKQGQSLLRKGEEHCCLGVLCRIGRVPSRPDSQGAVSYGDYLGSGFHYPGGRYRWYLFGVTFAEMQTLATIAFRQKV